MPCRHATSAGLIPPRTIRSPLATAPECTTGRLSRSIAGPTHGYPCWVRWVRHAPDHDGAGDDADSLGGRRAVAGRRGRWDGRAGRGLTGLVRMAGRRRRPVLLVP